MRHHWRIRSTHTTSEGIVVYESCPCGCHRVRLRCSSADAVVVARQDPQ